MIEKEVMVTQEDIDNGIPGDSDSCPIALAIRREFSFLDAVLVGKNSIQLEYDEGVARCYRTLPTTWKQSKFVRRFDRNRKVAPFSFSLIDPRTLPTTRHPEEEFILRIAKGRERSLER